MKLFFLLFFSYFFAVAQQTPYRFVNYDMEDGLPDNYGRCGFVDSRGLLWIGTEDGLASFDGASFTNYFHEAEENSLPKNYITDIAEDKKGQLWISTSGGLCRFDPYTGKFHNLHGEPGTKTEILANGSGNIFIDEDGLFWLSSYRGGFFSYNPKTNKAVQYTLPGYNIERSRDSNTAHNFVSDPVDKNILWISARNGLYRLNKKTGKIEHLIDSKPIPYNGISYTMHDLFFKKPHELWIGGWGCGLKKYNTKTGEVESFYYTEETGLRSNVLDYFFINDSTAWVATQNNGLGFFHLNTGKYEFLPVEPKNPYGMQATNINTIIPMDNLPAGKAGGQVWFVSYGEGISFYDPSNQGFSYVPLPQNPDKRSFDFVLDSLAKKTYVASRPSDYLHVFDYDGKLIDKIFMKGPADELVQNSFALCRDHTGKIWIAGNNIFSYDPEQDKMERFHHPVIDSVENARRRGYMDIVEDHQGNLWFFGMAGGLFRIDSSRKHVKTYSQAGKSEKSRFNNLNLRQLYVDKAGKTWLVHEHGLTSYDPKTERFTFHDDAKWGTGIEPLCMVQLGNAYWVGGHFNGLIKLVEENGQLSVAKRINRSDGLPSGLINSIEVDEKGQLWLGTAKGVVRFDPNTEKFRLYGKQEGISYPYIQASIKQLANGKLYVSSYNGFCVLDLEEYSNPRPPKVTLKNIKVLAEPVPLDTLLNFKKNISLNYNQDFFTIGYAAISFSQPERVRYAYRLRGYDKKWVKDPTTGNVAVYTGVAPGEYEFQVMAANADGVWGEPKTLCITITPPFWQTWWFYVLVGIAIICSLLYLSHLRSRNVRQKERARADFEKQLAGMELTALRAQMNPHFIFNCLNSIKHLMATGGNEEAMEYLMHFASLIRKVLDNSAKERISLSEELKMTNLYVKMEKLRFDDKFSYSLRTDPDLDLDLVELPPLILQPFVENAIWHGLMHQEGEAKLSINVEEDNGMLLCIIDDTGIGREKAQKLKSKTAIRKKSYGVKIAGNRLKLFNKLKESKVQIDLKIIDKFDDENESTGTTVLLKIPLWKTI